jgi:hypothetical protein
MFLRVNGLFNNSNSKNGSDLAIQKSIRLSGNFQFLKGMAKAGLFK